MQGQIAELLEEIEEYRRLAERFRNDAPSVWGLQLRLFGEKVTDLVGLHHSLDANAFDDRDEFLKHLHTIEAIEDVDYRHLDKIRWVGNQLVHGKQKSLSQESIAQAWSSFESLNESQFWISGARQPSVDIERLFGAVEGLFSGSGNFAKQAGKVALKGAGVAVAGALLYSYIEHTNSPEYNAQQERERQFNLKIMKGAAAMLGVVFIVALVSKLLN